MNKTPNIEFSVNISLQKYTRLRIASAVLFRASVLVDRFPRKTNATLTFKI